MVITNSTWIFVTCLKKKKNKHLKNNNKIMEQESCK